MWRFLSLSKISSTVIRKEKFPEGKTKYRYSCTKNEVFR